MPSMSDNKYAFTIDAKKQELCDLLVVSVPVEVKASTCRLQTSTIKWRLFRFMAIPFPPPRPS